MALAPPLASIPNASLPTTPKPCNKLPNPDNAPPTRLPNPAEADSIILPRDLAPLPINFPTVSNIPTKRFPISGTAFATPPIIIPGSLIMALPASTIPSNTVFTPFLTNVLIPPTKFLNIVNGFVIKSFIRPNKLLNLLFSKSSSSSSPSLPRRFLSNL